MEHVVRATPPEPIVSFFFGLMLDPSPSWSSDGFKVRLRRQTSVRVHRARSVVKYVGTTDELVISIIAQWWTKYWCIWDKLLNVEEVPTE